MPSWLYEQVLKVDPDREPAFSLQSTINWAAALRYEIEQQHGATATEQLRSCRSFFRTVASPRADTAVSGAIVEPLYSAVTNAMALHRIARLPSVPSWLRSPVAVTWYYSIYGACRSAFAANGQDPSDNHGAAMRTYSAVLQSSMPHPFNMQAHRVSGESYETTLPSFPNAQKFDLSKNFQDSRDSAQGMILQYLSGTTKWYAERTKRRLQRELHVQHFRTKNAQVVRDQRLESTIAFLHCAFRYRGKANYRDSIYLSYGLREPLIASRFVSDLATVSSFFVLAAAAFVERRLGTADVSLFFQDISSHIMGIADADPTELFWRSFIDGV